MFGFYFQREWAALFGSPIRLLAILSYAVITVWALADGLVWQSQMQRIQAETPADFFTNREDWTADLRRAEAGEDISPYAARPMRFTLLAMHTPGELAALAHRSESIQPHSALISGMRSDASLFQRYEVEGPSVLRLGRMDLAFVVIVILPLVLLLLTFDVLSQERAAGRFRIFLMQGGDAASLLWARILAVLSPVLAIPAICVLAAGALAGAPMGSTLVWLAALLAYGLFWAGVAALVAAAFSHPSTGAIAVLASWSVIVVLIPSAAQFLAQSLHPVPSRVSFLSEARDAEGQTRRNLTERAEIYMAEHPGQGDAPDEAVPGFFRSSYLANIDISARTAPMVQAFEDQQQAQRRFVSLVGYLSPAMLAQDLFFHASGTGPERAAAYRGQVRTHLALVHDVIGPATVNRSRITVAQAESIPDFRFRPPEPPSSRWLAMVWMLLIAALTGFAGLSIARTRS